MNEWKPGPTSKELYITWDNELRLFWLQIRGPPWWLSSKEFTCNAEDKDRGYGFDPWVQYLSQEDPLEKEMATHSSVFA